MSDYAEGSMRAIVCGTGVTAKRFWNTCKITVLTWTNHFREGFALSEPWCPFQASTMADKPL